MANPNAVSAYSEPLKPTIGGTWPATEQVQYFQQPYTQPGGQVHIIQQYYNNPTIAQIRDWLPWSIVNMFIGWLLGGILPLIFSIICRSHKRSNNESGARTMSTLALVFNILVTLGGLAGWITLIVVLVTINRTVYTPVRPLPCLTWPYC
jgi:hypothetical protein